MCFHPKACTSTSTENPVNSSNGARILTAPASRRSLFGLIVVGGVTAMARPANAAVTPVTKKATTTINGVAQPSYMVDSMWVTRSYYNGKWTYPARADAQSHRQVQQWRLVALRRAPHRHDPDVRLAWHHRRQDDQLARQRDHLHLDLLGHGLLHEGPRHRQPDREVPHLPDLLLRVTA